MKPLQVLSTLTVIIIMILAVSGLGGLSDKGAGSVPGTTSRVNGTNSAMEMRERILERNPGLRDPRYTKGWIESRTEAAQMLRKVPAGCCEESTAEALADGNYSGAIPFDKMNRLIDAVASTLQHTSIVDVLYVAATHRLIIQRPQVEISDVDGNKILDAGGKQITSNLLDPWFDYGDSIAQGKCDNVNAARSLNLFSEHIKTVIDQGRARKWLDAVRAACDDLGIEWVDFIRSCLLRNTTGGCFCAHDGSPVLSAIAVAQDLATKRDNATFSDSRTGITWTEQDNGKDISWNRAQKYCADRGAGWDLPTVTELQGLIADTEAPMRSCGKSPCRVTPSIRLTSWWFWSRESSGDSEAFAVFLTSGSRQSITVGFDEDGRALCVRRS